MWSVVTSSRSKLLVGHLQRLTVRQEVGRQCRSFGLESDPARSFTLSDAGQRVGELAVQGAQRVVRIDFEIVDVVALVLAKIHFLTRCGSSHEPTTARRRARRHLADCRIVGHCPSFMFVAFTRTTRRTDEDLDGLFTFLNLDFFFLTRS